MRFFPLTFHLIFAKAHRAWLVAAVIATVIFGALGFLPLVGGPGYESALVAGLVLPSLVAVTVAYENAPRHRAPLEAVARGATVGLLGSLLVYGISILHGLRIGFCAFLSGTLFHALGPLPGAIAAGVWGVAAGELAGKVARQPGRNRTLLGIALALVGPGSTLALGLAFMYGSPVVFAFDPFVGFFSGTFYDTVIDGLDRLLTYRVGTLGTLLGVAGVTRRLRRQPDGTLRWDRSPFRWIDGLTAGAFVLSATMIACGSRLGHWQTAGTIAQQLGAERTGDHCRLVYPATFRDTRADVMLRDCERSLVAVAAYLGVDRPPPVTVYVFADTAQKRWLMGAANTQVAKPWRHEVYVQWEPYPHPVLGHELAHAVAASFGDGPFGTTGAFGGWIPNPGLVEGLATDASPNDEDMSPTSWSRALLELSLLPPLRNLFTLRFFTGSNAATSYTAAGAFVGWIHHTYGSASVRRWYRGEELAAITGHSLDDLEHDFHSFLRQESVSPHARDVARALFDQPTIFRRSCPHAIDEQARDGQRLLASGDVRGAARIFDHLLNRDPRHGTSHVTRATCSERLGHVETARDQLRAVVEDPRFSLALRGRTHERLGDLALRDHDDASAAEHYEKAAHITLDEDVQRALDVKQAALRSPLGRDAITTLLVGPATAGPDPVQGTERLARWAEQDPTDALPLFLLAKGALAREDHRHGAALLEEALGRTFSLPRVARETARQRVIAACALGDNQGVAMGVAAWEHVGGHDESPRDVRLRALAARCVGP